jgi:serine phosphatase RsbU (regulator of sigma subunit)
VTASLHVLKGPRPGEVIPLVRDVTVLGRELGCHVVLSHKGVSRRHAQLVRGEDGISVEDLGSRNGTFVNDQPVTQRTPLKHNDSLRICDFEARFNADEALDVRVRLRVSAVRPLVVAGGLDLPDYLSPTQIDEPPDGPVRSPADDVHAVAVMAFQMLTGHLPFPERPLMAKLDAIAGRRFASAVERCRARGFPERLAALIDRCLANPPRAADVLREVEALAPPAPSPVPGSVRPRPGEEFTAVGRLFEDGITEAHEARGTASGARVTLRLFKPAFQGEPFVALVGGLVPSGPAEGADVPPGLLRRFAAGRARPLGFQPGARLTVDPDLGSEGCLCLVEEYAGNRTLADVLRTGELVGDEARAAGIVRHLLEALAAAHARGGPHGNLTPFCVFLGDTGVKVEGFGLHAEVEVLRLEAGGDSQSVSSVEAANAAMAPETLLRLLEVSDRLLRLTDEGQVLAAAADALFGLFEQADRCFVFLVEEETGRLVPRVTKARRPQDETNARFRKSLVKQCLESKQALLSDDADNDERIRIPSVAGFRIRQVMCAPLLGHDGRPLGAVQLDTADRGRKFTREDVEVLLAVAGQVALALTNARAMEEARRGAAGERERELARVVERAFWPRGVPQLAGYEFFAHHETASRPGGDHLGFTALPGGRWAVTVGRVAGRGVPGALVAAVLADEARACLVSEGDPSAAVAALNGRFLPITSATDRFATLFLAVLDPTEHAAVLLNAGHPFALRYRRADGSVEEAVSADLSGLPLGIMESAYASALVPLEPGDALLLFTDGVPEAVNDEDQPFGLEGIRAALEGVAGLAPAQAGRRVIDALWEHARERVQKDDLTLVCFGRLARGGTP